MRVGLLIVRVEVTGDARAPLRARVTEVADIDRPETERVAQLSQREDLHRHLDRWLDALLHDGDAASGSGQPGPR